MANTSLHRDIARLRPSFELPVERRRLPNGLTLLCVPEPGSGLCSVQFWVRTGSVHEGALLGSGLSHYLEHLLFKGTPTRAGREISATIQAHGGMINAYTTFDRTVYYADLPSEHVGVGLDVLADIVFRSTLPADEVAREKDVILREIAMTLDEPDSLLWQAVFETAYREHPYRQPVIGHKELFEAVTREQLLAYWKSRYTPDNVVVVVAGDVATDAVEAALAASAGTVVRTPLAPVHVPTEPAQVGGRAVRRTAAVQLTRGGLAYKIPGLGHADAAALDVLASILGSGNSSVLWRELREGSRVVHEIDASAWNPGDGGLLFVGFSADPERRDAAIAEIREIMEGAHRRRYSVADINKVVRQVLVHEVQSRRSVSGLAGRVGMAEVVVGDLGHFDAYLRALGEVDEAALRRVAGTYLVPERLTVATLDPAEKPSTPARGAKSSAKAATKPGLRELRVGGVPVLLQEDHRLPIVHLRALFEGGPVYEAARRRGVSALLATLLTRDTRLRTAAQVDAAIEAVGGGFHASSGNNSIGLAVELLPSDLKLAGSLLGEALLAPKFLARTVTTEREAQLAALRDEADDVVSCGRRLLREQLFGSHPLSVSPNGLDKTVGALDGAALREHRDHLLCRENLVLSIAGAVSEKEVRRLVEPILERLPKGSFRSQAPAFAGQPVERERIVRQPREQAVVYLGFAGPGLRDVDYHASEMANEFFSGMSSRLFERVREEKGLAYFVRSLRLVGVAAGGFIFESGTQPGREGEVLAEIRAEIARVRDGGATEAELERCRRRLVVARRMQLQSVGARAMQAGLNRLFDLPVDDSAAYEAGVNAVDSRRLAEFAERWLREERAAQLVVAPESKGS